MATKGKINWDDYDKNPQNYVISPNGIFPRREKISRPLTESASDKFEDVWKANDSLEYFGDFLKGGEGYKYLKRMYEKDPKKYWDSLHKAQEESDDPYDMKYYHVQLSVKAGDVEQKYDAAKDGDKAAQRWVKQYEKKVAGENKTISANKNKDYRAQRRAQGLSAG